MIQSVHLAPGACIAPRVSSHVPACHASPAHVEATENAGVEISGRLGHNPAGVENAGVN